MVKKYQSLATIFKKLGYSGIPFADNEAWVTYPELNHVYNKLWIAESQNIPCGPMGVYPELYEYPVIFKPIINLFGMSRGFTIVNDDDEYDKNIKDGFLWERYLTGTHRCIDIVIRNGVISFVSCWISTQGPKGTFEYHSSDPDYKLSKQLSRWVNTFFDEYTGCVNIETIGDKIIECHLRLNGDSHLYDEKFAKELHDFLNNKKPRLDYKIDKKYLIPIFVDKEYYKKIDRNKIIEICDKYNALTINFYNLDSINQSEHKSRLLMFDIDDLKKGFELRDEIIKNIL